MDKLTIRKIDHTDKSVIDDVVQIHLATFQGFFLTFMGRGFLRQMYTAYTKHSQSDILVATENGKTVGFLAYSQQLSGLYKYMIKHRLLPFAWYSLGAFLRKPKVFMRLVRAFLKPGEAQRNEKYVELASIGVHPDAKGKGVGSQLIDVLKNSVDFDEFAYITLETDVVDNVAANQFYVKNGFYIAQEYQTHEGRKMYEYRYEGERSDERPQNTLHTECCSTGQ